MKGGVVAALHALAALGGRRAPRRGRAASRSPREEDGGLGTFAALERDSAFDACLIPEPTGFDVVCAQAGALTFEGAVRGVAAHAAHRLEGVSAIDRYLPVHAALRRARARAQRGVEHPLMRALELPYPLLVGRVRGRRVVEQRARPARRSRAASACASARTPAQARRGARGRRSPRAGDGAPSSCAGPAGSSRPARRRPTHPFARLVRAAVGAELGRGGAPSPACPGAPTCGSFCARGIPCVMAGPPGSSSPTPSTSASPSRTSSPSARDVVRVALGVAAA